MIRHFLLLAGLAAFACGAPGAAQPAPAALAQLGQSLPGELINDPTSLAWDTQGEGLRVSGIAGADIPGGGAASRFSVRIAGANPWSVQAYVPLTADITRGEVVTLGFWARAARPPEGQDTGQIGLRIQANADPWPGFGDTRLAIGLDWKWYEVTTTATRDISRRNGVLVFQLGGVRQEIEIGQTIVIKGADRILGPGTPVQTPLPPQIAGKGQLISRPDSRDWSLAGPEGSHATHRDDTIHLDRVVRFTAPAAGAQAWEIQALVPLTTAVARGDRLLVAITARTVAAATEDGRALIGIRIQENREPFPGFADNRFKVGPNWQLIQIQTTATIDLSEETGVVALHFAAAQQSVDIGPVYVLKLPAQP